MIRVLCATKGERMPKGLEHIPCRYEVTFCDDTPWAVAANSLLDNCDSDALFLDDDIELTPHTFAAFDHYKHTADIIGFSLLYYTQDIQSAGHVFRPIQDSVYLVPLQTCANLLKPYYVAHVTASCFWISKRVIDAGIRFPVWEGQHYEDVAFTVEAWRKGFKVAYVPGVVYHGFNRGSGAGATKSEDKTFQEKRAHNEKRLFQWYEEIDLRQLCIDGVVPMGAQEVTP